MSAPIRDVLLPQLGMGMSEGEIVEWLVAEGAHVDRDQPLVSIENEKTVTELPAPSAGFVHFIAKVGDKLPIETVIAQIASTESAYGALVGGPASDEGPRTVQDAAAIGPDAGPPDMALLAAAPTLERILASGVAKALARNHDLDLKMVEGSGPHGRIMKRDVLRMLENALAKPRNPLGRVSPSPVPAAAPAVAARDGGLAAGGLRKATIPLTGARRTIAERMVRSSTEAAQTFVFFEVDVTDLLRVRKHIDESLPDSEDKTTALAYYAKAVALACQRVPIANATLEGNDIVLWNEVNIGVAVALPGGTEFDSSLIVPVVHGAESLSIGGLSRRIREQVQKARDGRLEPSDVSGGTITISSNAGMFPGMWVFSTPLLNMPQAIIFQPGNATKRPVVVDDEIVIRTILPCSLTFDHRMLDGEPVARFIRELSGFLRKPETMLV